jgi:hypothetical protein
MLWISRQARILIHQRDSRISSLSEFTKFWRSFRTRLNQSLENSIESEQILAELLCSSYSEDSRQPGKSSSPQNLASLSTLQEWTWEQYRGLHLTFFTFLSRGEHHGIYRRSKAVLWPKFGHVGPTYWAGWPSFLLAPPLVIGYLEHRLSWTHRQNGFWKCANTWLAGHTLAQLSPCFMSRNFLMSYCLWLCLILDIMMICMDFGPYGTFLSSDIP